MSIAFSARASRKAIWKGVVPQMSWASGASAEKTDSFNAAGVVRNMCVKVSNATNAITFTLQLRDANGTKLFDQAGIEKNAVTAFVGIEIYFLGTLTVGVTPSGDPGASGVTVDVTMYGD